MFCEGGGGGSKSAKGGSKSASRYGPGGPNPLADLDPPSWYIMVYQRNHSWMNPPWARINPRFLSDYHYPCDLGLILICLVKKHKVRFTKHTLDQRLLKIVKESALRKLSSCQRIAFKTSYSMYPSWSVLFWSKMEASLEKLLQDDGSHFLLFRNNCRQRKR